MKFSDSFNYLLPKVLYSDRLRAAFYENGQKSGTAEKGFRMFHPTVDATTETNNKIYIRNENVSAGLTIKNTQPLTNSYSVFLRVLDPDRFKIHEDTFEIEIPSGASETRIFTIPSS